MVPGIEAFGALGGSCRRGEVERDGEGLPSSALEQEQNSGELLAWGPRLGLTPRS